MEYLMAEVSAVVTAEAPEEAPYVSEAPRLEGRGFPERFFSLIGCPFLPAVGRDPTLRGCVAMPKNRLFAKGGGAVG